MPRGGNADKEKKAAPVPAEQVVVRVNGQPVLSCYDDDPEKDAKVASAKAAAYQSARAAGAPDPVIEVTTHECERIAS